MRFKTALLPVFLALAFVSCGKDNSGAGTGRPASAGLDRNGIVCALAWSQMSPQAKARVSLLYPEGLSSVAATLEDYLAIDKYNAYVPGLRKMNMNGRYFYDPNPTQAHGGDCLRGLRFAHYYLSHLDRFSLLDEELYFYHALLVNMVLDIHNLSLPALTPSGRRWTDSEGNDLMDTVCSEAFGNFSLSGIFLSIGNLSADEAAGITAKSFEEWAQENCSASAGLASAPERQVRTAVQKAGYRLAYLFNLYYGGTL